MSYLTFDSVQVFHSLSCFFFLLYNSGLLSTDLVFVAQLYESLGCHRLIDVHQLLTISVQELVVLDSFLLVSNPRSCDLLLGLLLIELVNLDSLLQALNSFRLLFLERSFTKA